MKPVSRRVLIITLLFSLLTTGCALFQKPRDEIAFQRGQFFITYHRAALAYVTIKLQIDAACTAKKLDAETCQYAADVHKEAVRLNKSVERAITNPEIVTDWEAIGETILLIASLAGKAL